MYLVIDIGGTWTKYGYYTGEGKVTENGKYETINTTIDAFYQKIESLLVKEVSGVAISMPGLLDSSTGYVHAITLLPFLAGHNLKEELQQYIGLPVSIENDAKCATLGEMWKGSMQEVNNGLMMVLGSGIGGTIIINGKIYKSLHHKAGEIGSILMPEDRQYTMMTNFGRHNNANALIRAVSQKIGCKEDGDIIFKEIETNSQAKEIFSIYCRQIAFMIYNLDYILDLDLISIGGGISEQQILITTLQQEFENLRTQYQEDNHSPIIVASHLHNEANLLGALYHHLYGEI